MAWRSTINFSIRQARRRPNSDSSARTPEACTTDPNEFQSSFHSVNSSSSSSLDNIIKNGRVNQYDSAPVSYHFVSSCTSINEVLEASGEVSTYDFYDWDTGALNAVGGNKVFIGEKRQANFRERKNFLKAAMYEATHYQQYSREIRFY